ncbi:MAG: 4-(cytidine 5'-diphospho)-2-C-methyl-D-erythritol kinase, partial [Bacteroidaceae bacterium]|nr:4-(cytidine 5'-diphospho)-2-C-methyl-D-erythritol kinase [Bacteroidaceae bacterium]
MMITRPNCKINLGLNVVERRPDGYHNHETVFYPVPLCDELVLEESETDQIEVKGIPVDGDVFDNLVWRAVKMLRVAGHVIPPIRVVLTKNIPNGAGLGGGSSDAAFMIKMLNENFSLGLSVEEMER